MDYSGLPEIDKIKNCGLEKSGKVTWSVNPGRNVDLTNRIPFLCSYDRKHFREDAYLLYTANKNPDKLITLLHEFNNIYIWPALAISLITFPDTKDITKFNIYKSKSKYAVPLKIDNAEKVWEMSNTNSIPRWMLTLPNLSHLTFNYTHVYAWKNDVYEKLFSRDLPMSDFLKELPNEAIFIDDLDPALKFSNIYRIEYNGKDPISSAILAPIYNNNKSLKAMVYFAYPRPDVMEGVVLFDFKCVLDMQFLLKIISLCFED